MRNLPDVVLAKMRALQHEEARCRSLVRVIASEQFYAVWTDSLPESRKEAIALIQAENISGLKTWVRLARLLDNLPIRDLYERAAKLGVPNYSRMTKVKLLVEIKKCQK